MRHKVHKTSFRQDAAMDGAIFISNTITRSECFERNLFGLPLEYQAFVNNVKVGMPLFLFDYNERQLYGVFEAASNGRLNINQDAFHSTGLPYPAQVRFNIIWKCRPLREEEFSPAIRENYYTPMKFYFDLSHKQVVQLLRLFDEKRRGCPVYNYSRKARLEEKHSSKETQNKQSLTPNIPCSVDHSLVGMPSSANISGFSALEANLYTPISIDPTVPFSVEPPQNVSMPLGTMTFGAHIDSEHSHCDQREFAYPFNELVHDASRAHGTSTQVFAPCSQTTKDRQAQSVANQCYPLSQHTSLLSSGYMTPNPAHGVRNHVSPSIPSRDPLYLNFSWSNPQDSANWQDHYGVCWTQGYDYPTHEVYASEHRQFGEVLSPPKSSQQVIPAYPAVAECERNIVPAVGQQKEGFTDYNSLSGYNKDFANNQRNHGIHSGALKDLSDPESSDIRTYKSDEFYMKCNTETVGNTVHPDKHLRSSVFSRLSVNRQAFIEETSNPLLNQLVSSLSQRTKQCDETIADDVDEQLVSEQVMNRPCFLSELSMPSQPEVEESIQPPFFNFKRRSEAGKVDANSGKVVSEKPKRRKLVRPSFGEDNTANLPTELQANDVENRKHSHLQACANRLEIDLNKPACVDCSDPIKDDGSIVLYTADVGKMQTPCGVNMNKPNCLNEV